MNLDNNKNVKMEKGKNDENKLNDSGDDNLAAYDISTPTKKTTLEKINEKDEDNYLTNAGEESKEHKVVKFQDESGENLYNIKPRVDRSRKDRKGSSLKKKKDDNKKDSKSLRRISNTGIGVIKKLTFGNKDYFDKFKMVELQKEKKDLQDINENMLNLLTEKELENEELQETYALYKNEIKAEIEQYIETIEQLEEKIAENNQMKENFDNKLDSIIEEYNKYKERMEKTLTEHIKKEDELSNELDKKERYIEELKSDIENLDIENKQFKSLTERKEDEYNNELLDMNIYITENEKLKNEVLNLQEKIKNLENKYQTNLCSKEEEIRTLKEDIEFKSKTISKIKEEKCNEINVLKTEINKNNRDVNTIIKKYELIQKENGEINNNIKILQNKLDKKTKELQEINDSAKKLLENKDNIIKGYEKTIEEINKEKTQLIDQNRDLLDKVRNANSSNLGDILNEDEEERDSDDDEDYENLLLKAEIKTLKEQLENQAHDLISLSSMEKEVGKLRLENEKLEKENKTLKKIQKYGNDNLMSLIKRPKFNKSLKKSRSRKSINFYGESFANEKQNVIQITNIKINDDKKNIPNTSEESKKINELNEEINKMNEEINKLNEEINKLNEEINQLTEENDKLKEKSALLKVQFLNKEFENETYIAKYKGIIKSISLQCQKLGMALNFDLTNL